MQRDQTRPRHRSSTDPPAPRHSLALAALPPALMVALSYPLLALTAALTAAVLLAARGRPD